MILQIKQHLKKNIPSFYCALSHHAIKNYVCTYHYTTLKCITHYNKICVMFFVWTQASWFNRRIINRYLGVFRFATDFPLEINTSIKETTNKYLEILKINAILTKTKRKSKCVVTFYKQLASSLRSQKNGRRNIFKGFYQCVTVGFSYL